ncbi:hypothetical protein H9Y04_27815 [Streptomyces sp. TRM66268-LWL]|uniref:Uncharacterized protein n=2 Tax=Streptomyces polyasparticus TaxID=2767826 RepID=A0ABR7SPT1_9ACTN|nr:hypothetical protein [Streptomyces polyasparticus]
MNDTAARDWHRLAACAALTTWAEPAGFDAVLEAAADPQRAPWYGCLIDRKFSVDNTFAQLSRAVYDSEDLADEKSTSGRRTECFRALVSIADTEYFDEQLADSLDAATVREVLPDIVETITRGSAAIGRARFDLATQLIDLAASLAAMDGPLAVRLAHDVLAVAPSPRALVHATAIVHRSATPEATAFGEYLAVVGDDHVRRCLTER